MEYADDIKTLTDEFTGLVEKLKNNESKLGRETLEKRYGAAYRRLKEQIKLSIKQITLYEIRHLYMPHFAYDAKCVEEIKAKVSEMFSSEETFEKAYNAAFSYDVNKCLFEEIGITLVDMARSFYVPYFISRVVVDETSGRIYSPLICRYRISGRWVSEDDPDGFKGYPASKEELISDYGCIAMNAGDIEKFKVLACAPTKEETM